MELIASIIIIIAVVNVTLHYAGKTFKWVVDTIYHAITGKQLDIWEE